MNVYWLTFRIEQNATYSARYKALQDAVKLVATMPWWIESTSFILFKSTSTIDQIAAAFAKAIDVRQDMALIGMTEFQSARAVGNVTDPDLFKLMPYATRA